MRKIIDSGYIIKILRRENIEKSVNLLKLVCLALCAALLFFIAKDVFAYVLDTNSEINDVKQRIQNKILEINSQGNTSNKQTDYSSIARQEIFGELGTKAPPPKPKDTKPVSNVALSLIGTFITDGESPYAIIEDKKKKTQEIFNISESIFDVATLEKINSDNVEIKRNGAIEILLLDDGMISSPDSSGDSGEAVVVDESELNEALENLPVLLTQARAVPYFKDGKSVGLRLFAIKKNSLYEKIGLKNGDILKSINGNSLGDITQAVKLFEKLKEQRSINLTLERNRKEQDIRYEIK